ncbi:MAG: hypothetical protein O4807_10610 [Trichodesmium sp. St19_bin2]|nr:hypothetical protein [Trichodesmium sp. St5_bin8]MDE5103404.1 hypothetical protein [Trichodesmium sp. St19_bin2]
MSGVHEYFWLVVVFQLLIYLPTGGKQCKMGVDSYIVVDHAVES